MTVGGAVITLGLSEVVVNVDVKVSTSVVGNVRVTSPPPTVVPSVVTADVTMVK